MAKVLTIEHEGKEYTLEFTRRSVERMEKEGFVASDIISKPVSTLPVLFEGAFYAHHRHIADDVREAIFKKIPNKSDFLTKLAEMYNEPIEKLFSQGLMAGIGNAVTTAIVGSLLCVAYAATKPKAGSLTKE